MEFAKLAVELIRVSAWPFVALIVVIMFRRQFSDLTTRVTKAKLPGGFEFEVEALKESFGKQVSELRTISTNPHQLSGKLEKAIIRLAQYGIDLDREMEDRRNYNRNRVLDTLEKSGKISYEDSRDIKKLFSILESNQITKVGTKELEEAMLAVSAAVARLEERRDVEVLCHEFKGGMSWHYQDSHEDKKYSYKYHFWSVIAAEAPRFNYSYEVYVEAAERHNSESTHRVYIPSRTEFFDILEFRKQELERFVRDNGGRWQWPEHWGPIIWSSNVDGSLSNAICEIVDTKLAIQFYRGKND